MNLYRSIYPSIHPFIHPIDLSLHSSSMADGLPPLHLQQTVLNNFDEGYVFSLCAFDGLVGCAASTNLIKFYDRTGDMSFVGQCRGHTDRITGIEFATTTPHVLFSCAEDGTLRVWDTRMQRSDACMRVPGSNELYSLAINAQDTLVAVGGEDKVHVVDMRQQRVAIQFVDSHTDPVTQLRFHPVAQNMLLSGSLDGLVNAFDLSVAEEEDALETVINVGSSVSQFTLFGDQWEHIIVTTHTETMGVWSLNEAWQVAMWDNPRAFLGTQEVPIDYLVRCIYDAHTRRIYLIAGNSDGVILLVRVTTMSSGLIPLQYLGAGHVDVVRDILWDFETNKIISGGEDGRICCWAPPEVEAPTTTRRDHSAGMEEGSRHRRMPFSPY